MRRRLRQQTLLWLGCLLPSGKADMLEVWLGTLQFLNIDLLTPMPSPNSPAQLHVVLLLFYCRPGFLSYSYAVAYTVADPVTKAPTPAGRALAAALAEADAGGGPRMVLPVLLACSSAAIVTDFSQGGCLLCIVCVFLRNRCSRACCVHYCPYACTVYVGVTTEVVVQHTVFPMLPCLVLTAFKLALH